MMNRMKRFHHNKYNRAARMAAMNTANEAILETNEMIAEIEEIMAEIADDLGDLVVYAVKAIRTAADYIIRRSPIITSIVIPACNCGIRRIMVKSCRRR